MNEWQVVGVLITLGGLIAGIGAPVLKLNSTISRVIAKLEGFEDALTEFKKSVGKNDEKIWSKLDEHAEKISDIQTDIEILKRD